MSLADAPKRPSWVFSGRWSTRGVPDLVSKKENVGEPRPKYEVVFAVWLAHFYTIANVYVGGIFLPFWAEEWPGATKTELGFIVACFQGFFTGSGMFTGKLIPKFGHQKVALVGTLLVGGAYFLGSIVPSIPVFYATQALLGIGCQMVWGSGMALVPTHFPRHRAKASGGAATGAGFGSLVVSASHAALLQSFGWREVFRFTAAAYLAVGLLIVVPLLQKAPPLTGKGAMKKTPSMLLNELVPLPPLTRDPVFWTLLVGFCIMGMGFSGGPSHLAAHLGELGCPSEDVANAYGLFSLLAIVGRVAAGPLGDKFDPVTVFGVMLFGFGLVNAGCGFASSCGGVTGFFGLMGVFSGPFAALFVPTVAQLFGMMNIPVAMGYLLSANGLAGFMSSTLAGLVRDVSGHYKWAYTFCALCICLGSSIIAIGVRTMHFRRTARRKLEMERIAKDENATFGLDGATQNLRKSSSALNVESLLSLGVGDMAEAVEASQESLVKRMAMLWGQELFTDRDLQRHALRGWFTFLAESRELDLEAGHSARKEEATGSSRAAAAKESTKSAILSPQSTKESITSTSVASTSSSITSSGVSDSKSKTSAGTEQDYSSGQYQKPLKALQAALKDAPLEDLEMCILALQEASAEKKSRENSAPHATPAAEPAVALLRDIEVEKMVEKYMGGASGGDPRRTRQSGLPVSAAPARRPASPMRGKGVI